MGHAGFLVFVGDQDYQNGMSFGAVGTEHKDCHLRLFSWISQWCAKVVTCPSCDNKVSDKVHFSLCWRQGTHLSRRQLALLELCVDQYMACPYACAALFRSDSGTRGRLCLPLRILVLGSVI